MSYEILKKEILATARQHYVDGTLVNDIRAATHATDLYAKQLSALELIELSKSVDGGKVLLKKCENGCQIESSMHLA